MRVFSGKAEAQKAVKNRVPSLTSKHFIQQYFLSFANDPILEEMRKSPSNGEAAVSNGDAAPANGGASTNGDHKERYAKLSSSGIF